MVVVCQQLVSNGLGLSYQVEISFDGGTSYSSLGIVVTTTAHLTPTQLGTISEAVKIRRRAYASL